MPSTETNYEDLVSSAHLIESTVIVYNADKIKAGDVIKFEQLIIDEETFEETWHTYFGLVNTVGRSYLAVEYMKGRLDIEVQDIIDKSIVILEHIPVEGLEV